MLKKHYHTLAAQLRISFQVKEHVKVVYIQGFNNSNACDEQSELDSCEHLCIAKIILHSCIDFWHVTILSIKPMQIVDDKCTKDVRKNEKKKSLPDNEIGVKQLKLF